MEHVIKIKKNINKTHVTNYTPYLDLDLQSSKVKCHTAIWIIYVTCTSDIVTQAVRHIVPVLVVVEQETQGP